MGANALSTEWFAAQTYMISGQIRHWLARPTQSLAHSFVWVRFFTLITLCFDYFVQSLGDAGTITEAFDGMVRSTHGATGE
jgi:hypothetical protein